MTREKKMNEIVRTVIVVEVFSKGVPDKLKNPDWDVDDLSYISTDEGLTMSWRIIDQEVIPPAAVSITQVPPVSGTWQPGLPVDAPR